MNASERKLVRQLLEAIWDARVLPKTAPGHPDHDKLCLHCRTLDTLAILSSEACPHGCVDGRVQFVHPGLAGAYECPIHGKTSAEADGVCGECGMPQEHPLHLGVTLENILYPPNLYHPYSPACNGTGRAEGGSK